MSVIPITMKGEPVLHARAEEVDPKTIATPAFQKLIADMVETMYAANGVGIAATQVGRGVRAFIAESSHGPIALINPVFKKKSTKTVVDEEGCLSVPGKFDRVRRSKIVTIEGLTADGKKVSFTADGFLARILQHELDHLDGTLYVDRVAEEKRKKDEKNRKV
jgi:peptide deformylase